MGRVGEIDLPDRLAPAIPRWATQLGIGLLCGAGAIVARLLLDLVVPGIGPFALVFPALILATLFAHWPAGVLTAALSILYGWRTVLLGLSPPTGPAGADPHGIARMLVIAAAAGITIVIAEAFRQAVRVAAAERDREIADRDLFLAEFDHRMKNNFAIVAGLLDMQKRRAESAEAAAALETARMRVESIAQAHRHLYRGSDLVGLVEMSDYLRQLCGALAEALFLGGKVSLVCEADPVQVPRDRAVSIGLVVNELVTNAAKHAFTGRDAGRIEVRFCERGGGWSLSVADNGVGLPAVPAPSRGGLGTRLIDAFARQAEGRLRTESDATGTRVTLDLAA
jgi:two-component sensor histidine kinase